jgi:hypothetical protein
MVEIDQLIVMTLICTHAEKPVPVLGDEMLFMQFVSISLTVCCTG